MLDVVISLVVGLIGGVFIQAYLRPLSALIERQARGKWSDPLIVAVERDPSIIWSGEMDWVPFSVYVDDPTRLPNMPAGRAEWMSAARAANAVDAFTTELKVTIQARSEAAVVIERIRVVGHRKIPVDHGIILTRTTGGADLMPRRFEIELDDYGIEPLITWIETNGNRTPPPGIVLAAGEVERFHIWAKTNFHSEDATWHEWTLVLDLLVEGKKTEFTIDDKGQPFVTVSKGQLPHRMSMNGSWVDPPDDLDQLGMAGESDSPE